MKRNKTIKFIAAISFSILTAFTSGMNFNAYAENEKLFSVSVPTALPVTVYSDGTVETSDEIYIVNRSEGSVAVTGISVKGINGWQLDEYGKDYKDTKPDTKLFGMSFCEKVVSVSGEADLSDIGEISPGSSLHLSYDVTLPVRSSENTDDAIGECIFTVGWKEGALKAIRIISMPDKTSYFEGENFDTAGLRIEALYFGGESREITDYKVTNGDNLKTDTSAVEILYEEDGESAKIEVPVKVTKKVTGIKITNPPSKVNYNQGELFDGDGMEVSIVYSDGETEVTDNYSIYPMTMSSDTGFVTVTKEIDGEYFSDTVSVCVTRVLSSLEIVSYPYKTSYEEGEYFNPEGASVAAVYSDGGRIDVTGSLAWSKGQMNTEDQTVTFTYSEGGKTVGGKVDVSVTRTLKSIYVKTLPSKLSYISGESFDTSGMVVCAVYASGIEKEITSYSCSHGLLTFTAPASTVKTYTTTLYVTPVSDIVNMFSLDEASFRSWNNLPSQAYIKPSGVTVYISDPSLDEAVTCVSNDINVTVSYSEGGVNAACTVPVIVNKA